MVKTSLLSMVRPQIAYKHGFDTRLHGNTAVQINGGDFVFVRKEFYNPGGEKCYKLWPVADGPFKVISSSSDTVVIKIGQKQERPSQDRLVVAPPPASAAASAPGSVRKVSDTIGAAIGQRPLVALHCNHGLSDLLILSDRPTSFDTPRIFSQTS